MQGMSSVASGVLLVDNVKQYFVSIVLLQTNNLAI